MAIIVYPTSLQVGSVSYAIDFDVQLNIKRNGGLDTYGLPGARWAATINFENELETMQRPLIEALIVSLAGGANRLQLHHLGRPVPNGTLRGAPIIATNSLAGAKSLLLGNCNGTLKAGDIIGVPGQIVMVTADAFPSGGNMTIAVEPAVRVGISAGALVTWNKPTILWIPKSATAGPFPYLQNRVRPAFSIELIEAYQ